MYYAVSTWKSAYLTYSVSCAEKAVIICLYLSGNTGYITRAAKNYFIIHALRRFVNIFMCIVWNWVLHSGHKSGAYTSTTSQLTNTLTPYENRNYVLNGTPDQLVKKSCEDFFDELHPPSILIISKCCFAPKVIDVSRLLDGGLLYLRRVLPPQAPPLLSYLCPAAHVFLPDWTWEDSVNLLMFISIYGKSA